MFVNYILEGILNEKKDIRFCQASSREIFGEPNVSPQTEGSLRSPRSPYGAAKLFADNLIEIYRSHHGIFCASAILYNHESVRRSPEFVSRKITSGVSRIKVGLARDLLLGNLDTIRDWGSAPDYVRAMWLMLQQDSPKDFIIATGIGHTVRDICKVAFSSLNLDYENYVIGGALGYRASEEVPLIGSPDKAIESLGWQPTIDFAELISTMTHYDYKQLLKA